MLATNARNYVALDLVGRKHSVPISAATSAEDVCGKGTIFAAERVCGCPDGQYYDVHEKRCEIIPASRDKEHLLFVLEYDHGGERLKHRLGLYSFAECTGDRVDGYVTKGEQECVRECTGVHSPGAPGSRFCECAVALGVDGKTCVPGCGDHQVQEEGRCRCADGCIVTEDRTACVPWSACERARREDGVTLCQKEAVCAPEHRLDLDGKTCVPHCDHWRYVGVEKRCEEQCPVDIPITRDTGECTTCAAIDGGMPYYIPGQNDCYADCAETEGHWFRMPGTETCITACSSQTPYYGAEKECLASCPRWSSKEVGAFACEVVRSATTVRHSVSFAGESHAYFFRRAVSYAALELGVRGRAAAFLETGAALAGLRLWAAAEEGFTPAVFFRAETLLASELWLTGEAPDSSALLGVLVRGRPLLLRCALGAVFRSTGTYGVALRGSAVALAADCILDLGRVKGIGDRVELRGAMYPG